MNHTSNKGLWSKLYASEAKQLRWLKRNPRWAGAYLFLLFEATETEGCVILSQSEARDFFSTQKQWRVFLDKLVQQNHATIETGYMAGERGRTSILRFNDWEQKQSLQNRGVNTSKMGLKKGVKQGRKDLSTETAQTEDEGLKQGRKGGNRRGVNTQLNPEIHTSLRFLENKEGEIRESKNSSSSGDDAVLFKEGSLAYLLEQLMQTYNAHRGALPEATTLGVHKRMNKGKKTRWGYLEDHLREYGSFERAKKILASATQECSQDDLYISRRYGLITVLRHAQERAEARDAAVSGKPTIEKGVWWRVLWPDSDGVEREQPALVKERVSDGVFSVAVITNEHIRTYEEGQKFTKVTTLSESKFITPYGGTPPCVERVKADEKAKKAAQHTTSQEVAHAGD